MLTPVRASFIAILVCSACARKDVGRPPSTSVIDVEAGYEATLLYALDAAAGERNRDPGYRAWLVGDGGVPWLDAYAARRRTFGQRVRDDVGGGAPAFEVCGWEARSVDALSACLQREVSESDRSVVRDALIEADRSVRPRWEAQRVALHELATRVQAGLASTEASSLISTLRSTAGLPPDVELPFRLVLVAKPSGEHAFARQAGTFLVHEVGPTETPGALLAVTFHELAHLAFHRSPERPLAERAFVGGSDSRLLAAIVWDEVLATAFGNGLAASRLDPSFRAERSFFADPHINQLAKALYDEWRLGKAPGVDPMLAERLTALVDAHWPPNQRPTARFLWFVTIHASDRSLVRDALRGVSYRSASRRTPLDDSVPRGPDLPPWAPQLVLVTQLELEQRPALVARLELTLEDARRATGERGGAVFRRLDADGTNVFVVVASSQALLSSATSAFVQGPALPPLGWSSLATRE